MADILAKKGIIIPAEGDFSPVEMSGKVSGKGFPNFDGEPDKEYSVAIKPDKKAKKWLVDQVMTFWEENKPSAAGDVPANFEGLLRRTDGKIYIKTATMFDGERNEIPIVNHKGAQLDPKKYGNFGDGTLGRVSATMSIYKQGKKYGVSLFLNAVKITHFEPYMGGGADAFGTEEGDAPDSGFEPETKPKKKKGKNKSKKK